MSLRKIFITVVLIAFFGCVKEETNQLSIDYEKYQLDNGLTIILHQDKSDPLVAFTLLKVR